MLNDFESVHVQARGDSHQSLSFSLVPEEVKQHHGSVSQAPAGQHNAPLVNSCCVLCALCKASRQLLCFHSSFSFFPQLSTHPALFLHHVIFDASCAVQCLLSCVINDVLVQPLSEEHYVFFFVSSTFKLFKGSLTRFPLP